MKSLLSPRATNRWGSPHLRFSPTAWAKLLFLRDRGMSEVGGFGVTRPDDLLYVEDVQTVQQQCSIVTVKFDDASVARFFDDQVNAGRQPAQFARVWIHTHPEISAQPSSTDEETFERVFGSSDWAVMFILSKTDDVYCRLRFNVGPGGALEIPMSVDYRGAFAGSNLAAWEAEYGANVRTDVDRLGFERSPKSSTALVELKPGEATAAVSERIARAGRRLADQGWTQETITETARNGKCAIEQHVELVERPDRTPAADVDAELREHLEQQCGWSQADIDEQLELGWALHDLLEWSEREDFYWFSNEIDDPQAAALFPIER